MKRAFFLALAACLSLESASQGQSPLILKRETRISLVTLEALSSKTSRKGDFVKLETAEDVMIEGIIAVPKATPATGQVIDVRQKGALGMNGRLYIRPLFMKLGDDTIRFANGVVGEKAKTEGGAVVGLVILSGGFTGRSAAIPAGSPLSAVIARDVAISR